MGGFLSDTLLGHDHGCHLRVWRVHRAKGSELVCAGDFDYHEDCNCVDDVEAVHFH